MRRKIACEIIEKHPEKKEPRKGRSCCSCLLHLAVAGKGGGDKVFHSAEIIAAKVVINILYAVVLSLLWLLSRTKCSESHFSAK